VQPVLGGGDDARLVPAGELDRIVGPGSEDGAPSAVARPMAPPVAPAASTPAVPAPTQPNSRRRETPAGCGSLIDPRRPPRPG
jgi:hypothetical protein